MMRAGEPLARARVDPVRYHCACAMWDIIFDACVLCSLCGAIAISHHLASCHRFAINCHWSQHWCIGCSVVLTI